MGRKEKRRRRKCYSYTTERINAIFLILVVSSRNSFSSSGRRRRRERIYIYMRHLVFRGGSSDFYDQRAGGWPVNGRPVTAQLSVPFSFFSLSLCAFDPSFIPSLGFSFFPFPCMTAHESLYNTVRKCRSDGINFDEFPNKKKISKKNNNKMREKRWKGEDSLIVSWTHWLDITGDDWFRDLYRTIVPL